MTYKQIYTGAAMDLLLMSFAGVTAKEYLTIQQQGNITPSLYAKIQRTKTLNRHDIIRRLDQDNIGYITYEHELYPPLLKEIYDFPYILYYRGNLSILSENARRCRQQKSKWIY